MRFVGSVTLTLMKHWWNLFRGESTFAEEVRLGSQEMGQSSRTYRPATRDLGESFGCRLTLELDGKSPAMSHFSVLAPCIELATR